MSSPLKRDNIPFWGRIAKGIILNETNQDIPDKVKTLRASALRQLFYNIRQLRGEITAMNCFFDAIAEKKCAFISESTNKSEINEILKLCLPQYDGMKFREGKYHVHEEEIITLSAASLKAPLKSKYVDRMMELLNMLMPEAYEECFGDKKKAM